MRSAALRLLFSSLKTTGYDWEPQTPDRLLNFRKDPSPFRPLVRFFGLGVPVSESDLRGDGLGEGTLKALEGAELALDVSRQLDGAEPGRLLRSAMAVSGVGEVLIVHDHWPPSAQETGGYVHYGAESVWLGRALSRELEGFIDKRVLDLGCSSGALAFETCVIADKVLGLDISGRAIAWARDTAAAYGYRNVRFETAAVGEKAADDVATAQGPWDCVVMNPPMVVPSKDAAYAHRDGGKLGIELPRTFLDFADRHLRKGGEVLTLITNPIVGGRDAFFDGFSEKTWEVLEKRRIHTHFNQTVARKEGYAEQGIERIELWYLHLVKRP